jgi:cytochrome bd-type quinol oxidase subunit 1
MLWFTSVRLSVIATYGIQLGLLLAAIVAFLFLRIDQIGVWILGMFLTLATGVSEAWRVTGRVLAGVEYRPSGRYTPDEQRSFLSGTNIATALFLPLFLTTYLHPGVESSYLPSVMIWLLICSLAWFRFGPSISLNALTVAVFIFGTSLPLILGFAADVNGEMALPTPPLERLGAPYTIMVGLSVVISIGLKTHKRLPEGTESLIRHYEQRDNAIALTGTVSAMLAFVGFIVTLIIGPESSRYDRLNWLILIYVVLSVAAASWRWWVEQPGPDSASVESR